MYVSTVLIYPARKKHMLISACSGICATLLASMLLVLSLTTKPPSTGQSRISKKAREMEPWRRPSGKSTPKKTQARLLARVRRLAETKATVCLISGFSVYWPSKPTTKGKTSLARAITSFLQGRFNYLIPNIEKTVETDSNSAEYVFKYNTGNDVPYTEYTNSDETQSVISEASRGELRPIAELLYAHYNGVKNLDASWTKAYRDLVVEDGEGAEGGSGDFGTTSGGYDVFGFGTALYRLEE
jgi:hypothetical protein